MWLHLHRRHHLRLLLHQTAEGKAESLGLCLQWAVAQLLCPVRLRGMPTKVNAATGMSQKAAESKDVKTLLLMVLITCVVVCIALGVYYYMTIGE